MKKPKKVNYRLIPREGDKTGLYEMLDGLVEDHHEHLTNAKIAVAWNLSWQPDVDGRVTLGKCKRASDLDRELAGYDFVVILRQEFFQHPDATDDQRRAILDHELCHAEVKCDEDGEPLVDEQGRTVYRIRKHDIEEFSEIVARHGCYRRDIEVFAAQLEKAKQLGLPGFDGKPSRDVQEIADRVVALGPKAVAVTRAAIEAIRPKPGSGVESVSITHIDKGRRRKGVTLHADGRTEVAEAE